ncbi:MAG: TauD/TfdA family dioxygenase [Burkholderiaceae bacterium]|nr:TauD/TfdA family dioxygenase [Burkholderiaceae bacterium]MBP6813286.1 TauD/TfdA family dioxygenase [Burkholderiaceae bacterium]MBP7658408.1 TauD/TfdA family dioxygenase [Burkholderiaceae bacterium]
MRIVPLTEHTGADILDVDVKTLTDAQFERIYQTWLDRCVVRFRDQQLDIDDLQRFSARFGPLEEMPQYSRMSEEAQRRIANKYVTVISNVKVDGKPIGGLGNAEASWHSDMTYNPVIPTASVLLGEEIPPVGGDTHFANQFAAYEALPAALKQRLETVRIKHDAAHNSVGELRSTYAQPSSPVDAPGAVHPAVMVHPETGRKALFLGRRDWAYIPGLSLADSEALLDEIWSYAAPAQFVWTQQWRVGDVVIWDNRSALHKRDDFDPAQRRLMRRCQVLARQ